MSSLANNIGLSIFTFLSRIVSGSIVYIILARLMSVNDFGVLSFGTTLAGLVSVMAEFGFSLMAQRDIPQDRFNFETYVFNTFIQKSVFSFIALVGGLVYLSVFFSGLNVIVGIVFIVNAIINSNNIYFFAVFRAKNMFKIESWLALVYSLFIVVLIVLYYLFSLDVLYLAYGLLLGRFIQLIVLIFIFLSKFKLKFEFSERIQLYLFKNSFSFGAHYIIGIFYFSIDNQMIVYYSGNEQLAIYQAFFKILVILLSVNSLLEGVFLPFLSSKFREKSNEFRDLAKIINKLILTLGLSLFVFFIFFASDILKLLYSDKYLSALVITIPISLILLSRVLATVYSVILTISSNQNLRVITVLVSLIINVILNFIFIPKYGFIGAAYVSMITHFALVGLYIYFGHRLVDDFLLEWKFVLFAIGTIVFSGLVYHFKSNLNMIHLAILFICWFVLLLMFYSKKQFIEIKELIIGRHY